MPSRPPFAQSQKPRVPRMDNSPEGWNRDGACIRMAPISFYRAPISFYCMEGEAYLKEIEKYAKDLLVGIEWVRANKETQGIER